MSGAFDGGRVLAGRYRLQGELGRGGMGVVWQAWDEILGREVAVKEVRAPAGLPEGEVRRLYARLEREGRAAARISHRNVVIVHDVVTEDGRPWIVMELVRGMSFGDELDAQGPVTPARAAHVGAEVLAALRAAHEVGVLHRDVKPANVLIANDGRVVLTDFGIARIDEPAEGTGTALTVTGQLVGSPEFLAPERVLGRPPGPESDLWSLGVTLYAAVEGHSPFRQDTPYSTLRAVVDEQLPPPRRAGVLLPVLDGLLRKDPALRMGPAEAERLLRTASAGGAPSAVPAAYSPAAYSPTVPAHPVGGSAPPSGAAPVPSAPGAGDGAPGRRSGGAGVVLVAVVLVAVLAIGGLVWALISRDGSGGSSSSGSGTGGGGGRNSGASSSGAPAGSGGGGTSGQPTPSAGYGVTVKVKAVRDRYSGPCPAPTAQAPSFWATISVDRTPAEVVYRWVTGSGKVADGGWQTVSLGESRAVTVRHTETGRDAADPAPDWIAVEVKSPRQLTSSHVRFTVTCRAKPTDGPSSPGSSGPSGSPGESTYGSGG